MQVSSFVRGLIVSFVAGAASAAAQPISLNDRLTVEPLTTVEADGSGYLADPQPIRLAPWNNEPVQFLSGTTKAILQCAYPIRLRCFTSTSITADADGLSSELQAAGVTVTNIQNIDIIQDDFGRWQAAVTIGVHSVQHPQHWTVVAHAHPAYFTGADAPPAAWSADTVLSGSFKQPVAGNYDGKYYYEDGRLYLLYVQNLAPGPDLRNGIVLQPMRSFTETAGAAVLLLTPGDRYGTLKSETFGDTPAKLVEAPWMVRIAGKHALIYSTGSYLTSGYKAGVAWSDTLIPAPGRHYRKVLEADPTTLWDEPGGFEVRYLVQSAHPGWPNFTGAEVIGPGVASAVEGPDGDWRLFFDGFAPDDMRNEQGKVEASHRRPFSVRLCVAVPPDQTVAEASDAELATWLAPDGP